MTEAGTPSKHRAGAAVAPSLNTLTVVVLCIVNLNESCAGNIIWPFIPFLVSRYALREDVGAYTGVLAASFFLGQALFVSTWGRLSDKLGRRPVMLWGLVGSALTMIAFGFARNYGEALLARFICGAVNGNIAINKVYMGETTTAANQAKGFSYLGLTWGLGLILAPSLGGFTADAASQYPGSALDNAFTRDFPYALPSLIAAALGFCGFLLALCALPETAAWQRRQLGSASSAGAASSQAGAAATPAPSPSTDDAERETTSDEELDGLLAISDDDDGDDDITKARSPSSAPAVSPARAARAAASVGAPARAAARVFSTMMSVLDDPELGRVLIVYGAISCFQILFDELMPIFCATAAADYGLGWKARDVGAVQIAHGVVQIFTQLWIVPRLQRRYGLLSCFQWALVPIIPLMLAFPALSFLADDRPRVTAAVIAFLALRAVTFSIAFTSLGLLLNNLAPPRSLGAVTGAAQAVASCVRAIGPAVGGAIFSLGQTTDALGAWRLTPPYVLMALLTVATLFLSRGLPTDCDEGPRELEAAEVA